MLRASLSGFGLKPSRGSDAISGFGEGMRGDGGPFTIAFDRERRKGDVAVSLAVAYRTLISTGDPLTSRSMFECLHRES